MRNYRVFKQKGTKLSSNLGLVNEWEDGLVDGINLMWVFWKMEKSLCLSGFHFRDCHLIREWTQGEGQYGKTHDLNFRVHWCSGMSWISCWLCWSGVKKRDSYGYESRHLKLVAPCSVSKSSDSLRLNRLQHTRLLCPSPYPRACSNSCPLSWWCHPTILSSAFLSSCPQSFPASGSFHESTLHQVTKVLELQLQHQSFHWIVRVDFL